MNFSYLASPYTVKNPISLCQANTVKERRYKRVIKMAAELMEQGHLIFCPIAHSHSIETIGMKGKSYDGEFWLPQDFAILQHAKELLVFMMDGWKESDGVQAEIDFAKSLNIPIRYLPNKAFESKRRPDSVRALREKKRLQREGRLVAE